MTDVKQILDEYRLDAVVRTTVHTTVFRATDPHNRRPVVIKLINPGGEVADELNKSSFGLALRVAKGCAIRCLPRVLDYGFTPEENAFVVAEVVPAATDASSLRGEASERIVSAMVGVLDAVDELAMAGIPHLNLSLENVVLSDNTVRLVGFGTAPYLIGCASGAWPPDGARYSAPELLDASALKRDDLWLADLYSVALMACDLLGVEVSDPGTAQPKVTVPSDAGDGYRQFASVIEAALRVNPASRTTGFSNLREALSNAEFPTVEKQEETAVPDDSPPVEAQDDSSSIEESEGEPEPQADVSNEAEEEDIDNAATAIAPPGSLPSGPSHVEIVDTPVTPILRSSEPESTPDPEVQEEQKAGDQFAPDNLSDTRPPARRGQRPKVPTALLAVVAAVFVVLVVLVAVFLGARTRGSENVIEPVVQAAAPTSVPDPGLTDEHVSALHPLLDQADRQFAEGDMDGARVLLEALSDEEVDGFSAEERELLEYLSGAVGSDESDTAIEDLRDGLRTGSVRMLRRGVAELSQLTALEIGMEPGLEADLDRARAALRAHEQLWQAKNRGDHLGVIERSEPMSSLLPEYGGSTTLKEEAAVAIEATAEEMITRREYQGALQQLEGLRRVWPDRDRLVERIQWCRDQKATDERMMAVLEQALRAGQRGDPEEGLRVLSGTTPRTDYVGRFDDVRGTLNSQLDAMDARPPEIIVPSDFDLVYKKNTTVVVPVTVTDDFRVARVAAHVRRESETGFGEIVLETSNGAYPFEITPEIHGNKKLHFYLTAVDRAGHEASLGSPDQPLTVQRKRWYKK